MQLSPALHSLSPRCQKPARRASSDGLDEPQLVARVVARVQGPHGGVAKVLEEVDAERVDAGLEVHRGAARLPRGVHPAVVRRQDAVDVEEGAVVGVGAEGVEAGVADAEAAGPAGGEELVRRLGHHGPEGGRAGLVGEVDGRDDAGAEERQGGGVRHGRDLAEGAGVVDVHQEAGPALGLVAGARDADGVARALGLVARRGQSTSESTCKYAVPRSEGTGFVNMGNVPKL